MIITHKRENMGQMITHLKSDFNVSYKRQEIVELIAKGLVIHSGSEDGPQIHIMNVEGKDYLRTDRNETAKDNLENLPTF